MRVVVAVPVRDEEDRLPHLLNALKQQLSHPSVHASLYLLFDGCMDRGVDIAMAFFSDNPAVGGLSVLSRSPEPNAGAARRAACAFAISHLPTDAEAVVLTTDADTVPDPNWIECAVANLAFVDVIAGYTSRDQSIASPSRDALEHYLERLHTLRRSIDPIPYDPAPSHPWVGGANLAMRRTAYQTLGGFHAIPTGEDSDLVDRARHAGLWVRHARDVRVTTSSRIVGRAHGGLADALDHMQRERGEPRVEHPADAARQYARHAAARQAFTRDPDTVDWTCLAKTLGTQIDLRAAAGRAVNAEAFVMQVVPVHPTRRDLPLGAALDILRTLNAEQFLEPEHA